MGEIMMDDFETIDTLATKLKVDYITIWRLINDRKLAATKIGTQWRISKEAIKRYIDSKTIKVKAA